MLKYLRDPKYPILPKTLQRKSRLTTSKQSRLIEHIVSGATARAAAEIVEVQAITAIQFHMNLRTLIASKIQSYELSGEIEADESYFGACVKVSEVARWRGSGAKLPFLGF